MNIGLFSILIMVASLFLIVKTILKFKDSKLNYLEMIFWNLIWICLIIIASLPSIASSLAFIFGINNGSNLVVYSSIIALFFLNYALYNKILKQDREITRLVRELSKK